MNIVPALTYHINLAFPAGFTELGARLLAEPGSVYGPKRSKMSGNLSNIAGTKHFLW